MRRRWERKRLVRGRPKPAEAKPAAEKPAEGEPWLAAAAAAVIDAMSDGVALIDMDGKMASVNPAWQKITGLKKSEVVGKNVADIISKLFKPEDLEKVLGFVRATLDGKVAPPMFATIVSKDGREIPVSPTASLIKDAEGKPAAVVVTVKDITELKRAEEVLRKSEEKFRELAESLPEIVYEMDMAGRLTFVNQVAFNAFGYSQEEFDKGLNVLQTLIPEDRDRGKENIRRILSGEKLNGNEYTALRKDGSTFPVIIHSSPIIRENKPVGLRGIIIDITERKRAEGERVKATAMEAAAEADEKRIAELTDARTALLNILEDSEKARAELEHAYKELAVLERARAFILMLFKDVFEPLLNVTKPETVTKVAEVLKELSGRVPIAAGVRVAGDGSVSFDEASIREALNGLSPNESITEVVTAFSEIMDACYPSIRADTGDQKATEIFSNLFKERRVDPYKPYLLRIVPEGVELPGLVYKPLEPGKSYLVEESKAAQAFFMFGDMLTYEFPGLCISTTHPADVKSEHRFRGRATVLWLSNVERDYVVSPSNLGLLRDRILTFVAQNENAVVLLDGLEYLVTTNGFGITLKFLHDVREAVMLNRARFIVPVAPGTLEPKQLEMLERYMEVIEVVEEEK